LDGKASKGNELTKLSLKENEVKCLFDVKQMLSLLSGTNVLSMSQNDSEGVIAGKSDKINATNK
jgi:hypothetical protein